jgi:hypothetical protein
MTTYGKEITRKGFSYTIQLPFELEHTMVGEKCEEVVQFNWRCIALIPEEKITPELARMAVEDSGMALGFIPEGMRTLELCDLALEDCGLALKFIPDEMKTKERCIIAVKNSSEAFRVVPLEFAEELEEFITDDGFFV